jgi:hypothetical protein
MGQTVKLRLNQEETHSENIGRGIRLLGYCMTPTLINLYEEYVLKEALEISRLEEGLLIR